MQTGVAGECTRQQTGLAEHLKTVADSQHRQPTVRSGDDFSHHRGEFRDGAAAQVVAVGEPAGHHHRVDILEGGVGVPQADRLGTDGTHCTGSVHVVERSGKGDDATPGRHGGSRLTVQSSITVLASGDSAISARAESSTLSSTSSSNRLPCRTFEIPACPSRPNAPTIAWPCGSRISPLGITCTTTRATRTPPTVLAARRQLYRSAPRPSC